MNLLKPGDSVNNTYSVERHLGSGAFAEVYLVSHRFLGRQALKAFRLGSVVTALDVLREARVLVDLTHPQIVRVYDANVSEGASIPFAYLTMESSTQGTLADLLAARTQLPLEMAVSFALEITEALAFTHGMVSPLIHRDVKPSNVLLFGNGSALSAKLADYGLAATIDSETRLSRSAGTIAFAPPEMAWGFADERTDVYSVGVTLYRMLTGIHPFPLRTPDDLARSREFAQALSHGRKSILPPSRLLMHKMDTLDDVVMKALAFEMFDRFRNAGELHKALMLVKEKYSLAK